MPRTEATSSKLISVVFSATSQYCQVSPVRYDATPR